MREGFQKLSDEIEKLKTEAGLEENLEERLKLLETISAKQDQLIEEIETDIKDRG